MAFIDGHDVIQQVTATAADPALRDSILQGLSNEVRMGSIFK
jgi:hypothetical protein